MELFLVWFVLSLGVAVLADSRGRSGVGFFLLSAALSPLLGLIVVLVTRNVAAEERARADEHKRDVMREHERAREHEAHLASIKAMAPAAAAAGPQPVAVQGGAFSVATELEKLASLKERGVLTEDEFGRQKAALLGRGHA